MCQAWSGHEDRSALPRLRKKWNKHPVRDTGDTLTDFQPRETLIFTHKQTDHECPEGNIETDRLSTETNEEYHTKGPVYLLLSAVNAPEVTTVVG